MPRPRQITSFDELLESESEASDVESCVDKSVYQESGDMPEEDAVEAAGGSYFSLPTSAFYTSSDTSTESLLSPSSSFKPGQRWKRRMECASRRKKRRVFVDNDEDDADDPEPMTAVRSPSWREPTPSTSKCSESPSLWDTPLLLEEPTVTPVPSVSMPSMSVHSVPMPSMSVPSVSVPVPVSVGNVELSATLVPSSNEQDAASLQMTLKAPGTSLNIHTSLSATPVPLLSATPGTASATPSVSPLRATPVTTSATTPVTVSATTPVTTSAISPLTVSVSPLPSPLASPLTSPSANLVPGQQLTPNELKSRKRARGPLRDSGGSPIVQYEKDVYRTRDGNVWHRDPNPRMPKVSSPHTVPPGSATQRVNELTEPHELFELFLPDEELAAMAVYTNDKILPYRAKYKAQKATTEEVSISELKALIGILLMSGLKNDNHVSPSQMFSPFVGCPLYRATMSSARFCFLMRVLKFDDSRTRRQRREVDKLAPIRSLWEKFIDACKNVYVPGPHLTIDEQLVPFRGKTSFKMYIPNKPAK